MSLYQYQNFRPSLGQETFIAPSAQVIGRAFLDDNVNIWFNTVVRADVNEIKIGKNVNVQDLSMLHVVEELPLIINDNVSIGHSVTLHACSIGRGCLIGMNSVILDGAEIGENSLVAAGSLIPPGKKFPPQSFIVGHPAKVKRELTKEEVQEYSNHYKTYLKYKEEYLGNSFNQC